MNISYYHIIEFPLGNNKCLSTTFNCEVKNEWQKCLSVGELFWNNLELFPFNLLSSQKSSIRSTFDINEWFSACKSYPISLRLLWVASPLNDAGNRCLIWNQLTINNTNMYTTFFALNTEIIFGTRQLICFIRCDLIISLIQRQTIIGLCDH
jgi:hypothetical protein